MFKIMDKYGNDIVVNEIFEEGFNLTIDKVKAKQIKGAKKDVIGSYLIRARDNKASGDGVLIPTGINSLDKVLGGGLKAGLYVIGANPGAGKTSLTLHLLSNLSQSGYPSVFFSLDMSDVQTSIRLLANTSYRFSELDNFNINDLSDPKTIFAEEDRKEKLLEVYRVFNTQIDPRINVLSAHPDVLGKLDNSVSYVESVEVALKNYKKYYNYNPVVVIDFLQLLQNKPVSSYRDENDGEIFLKSFDKRIEMDKIIEKLKKYSTTYNVPIIVITSTNRSSYSKSNEYNQDAEYDISFSKESGNIEYMADVLIRLTPGDSVTTFGGPNQERVNLNIVKSRFGCAHVSIPLNFIPEYAFFSEVTDD